VGKGHGRLLLVDDTPANLSLLVDTLQDAGYEIRVAESGERALKQMPLVEPDLVLLDVMMPGLDGYETCRRIKAETRWRDIPILFVTAVSDVMDKLRGFEAGGVDYITKPFHPREVLARVTAHLQLAALRDALARQNAELAEQVALRVEAEQRLHRSLDRAIILANPDGTVVFQSLAAEQILARSFAVVQTGCIPERLLEWVRRPPPRPDEVVPQLRARVLAESDSAGGLVLLLEDEALQPKLRRLMELGLTPREAEVLYWLSQGKAAPDIATILEVSHHTIRKHAQTVLDKLRVENRTGAVRLALEKMG
jgi:DNA-binding response OmpR family regulator